MVTALISADMEGATGVTCPPDCTPGTEQYERFRPIFTGDVDAVAKGFFDAGVEQVVVTEAHGSMRNLLLERLDPRVTMVTGRHKTYAMLEGIQARPDLLAFVGYHSAAGTPGVLSHTFIGAPLVQVTLNGATMSEGYLNALLGREFGARVALVSGDDLTCLDAARYAPGAARVAVKQAVDRHTALCRHPDEVHAELRRAAADSVATAGPIEAPEPPYVCELQFATANCAAAAALVPGFERPSDRTVRLTYSTADEVYRAFTVATRLAQGASEPTYG